MYDYLKSGRQAIRLIYFLIIGLAITDALKLLFLDSGAFRMPSVEQWLLFAVFFSFVSRFFLGAYRVISQDIEIELTGWTIVIDMVCFVLQALAFYVYALNFRYLTASLWMILIICALDLVWLAVLAAIFGKRPKTFIQWILHNISMGIVVLILFEWRSVSFLLITAVIAFCLDFAFNYDFYFALKTRPGLRIFVAGPYGDRKPKDEIDANVENAREVGKQLAQLGHYPFIPHTMLHGWETDNRFTVEDFKRIDHAWLEFCDALFFIAESPGANQEKEIAIRKGLQVFERMCDVPKAALTR